MQGFKSLKVSLVTLMAAAAMFAGCGQGSEGGAGAPSRDNGSESAGAPTGGTSTTGISDAASEARDSSGSAGGDEGGDYGARWEDEEEEEENEVEAICHVPPGNPENAHIIGAEPGGPSNHEEGEHGGDCIVTCESEEECKPGTKCSCDNNKDNGNKND